MSSTLRSSPSFSCCSRILANLLSFPTRRSSDLFNALSALSQTALVVEGTVKEAVSEFSEDTGPWTRFELSEVVVHFGEGKLERLALLQRGGNHPDGRMLVVSTSPQLVVGARYLVFLRNTSWNLTPVV